MSKSKPMIHHNQTESGVSQMFQSFSEFFQSPLENFGQKVQSLWDAAKSIYYGKSYGYCKDAKTPWYEYIISIIDELRTRLEKQNKIQTSSPWNNDQYRAQRMSSLQQEVKRQSQMIHTYLKQINELSKQTFQLRNSNIHLNTQIQGMKVFYQNEIDRFTQFKACYQMRINRLTEKRNNILQQKNSKVQQLDKLRQQFTVQIVSLSSHYVKLLQLEKNSVKEKLQRKRQNLCLNQSQFNFCHEVIYDENGKNKQENSNLVISYEREFGQKSTFRSPFTKRP